MTNPSSSSPSESPFLPTEVAFRKIGKTWQRKVVKTEKALDALLAKLEAEGAEVLTRTL